MFRKFRSSLAFKIILPMVLILAISVAVSGIVTYSEMSHALDGQMRTFVSTNMTSAINTINDQQANYDLTKEQLYNDLVAKARSVAEIMSANPGTITNDKLYALNKSLAVSEIHISDQKGLIEFSTVPEFVGFDFDSSDQSRPFMKALTDKNFVLVQEPQERGADKVLFQYAAVARQDAPGIIQVGVEPKTMETLLKNMSLSKIITSLKIGNEGYAFITDLNGVILNHKTLSLIGKNLKDSGVPANLSITSGELYYNDNGQAIYTQYKKIDDHFLFITVPQSEFLGSLHTMLGSLAVIELIIILLGILTIILLMRKIILLKINTIVALINKTAAFDLTYDKSFEWMLKLTDEIGVVASATAAMRKSLREIAGSLRNEAQNVLTNSESLAAATNESSASSEEISHTVESIATGASEQAKEAQEASSKLVILANEINTIVESSAQIKEYTDDVNKANEKGYHSLKELEEKLRKNNEITDQVASNANRLSDKSSSISQIIDTIKSIADQTNLLALNAAIEAARAGEAGKGFAVVADEIRKLAEQTSISTKEIGSIVNEIQREIAATKESMDSAGIIVGQVNGKLAETVVDVESISKAIKKTIENIDDLVISIRNIDSSKNVVVTAIHEISAISEESAASTEEVSASVEQQSSTIEEMSATADSLKEIAEKLMTSIKGFKI